MPEIVDISTLKGLSEEEAERRLRVEGYNELPAARKRDTLAIAVSVLQEPMLLLLIAAGSLYLVLGDLHEGVILLFFVFVIIGITIYQERKTERALEALRDLSSPRALVIRDGVERRIAGREVARGDLLIITEGDRVPADGVVLTESNLLVDESLLTGESVPVRKIPWDGKTEFRKPGGEDQPFVYSSTLIVGGQGYVRVERTGINTEIGKIGRALHAIEPQATPLQKSTARLVRGLAVFSISIAIVIVIVYGIMRGDFVEGLLAGITLAMATIPEEIPVVLTIFLALGAARISRKRVLTRRMPAVETIGETTVLCVDKTGTITQNRMAVAKLYAGRIKDGKDRMGSGYYDVDYKEDRLPERFHELLEFSILASEKKPFDPMEKAFMELGEYYLSQTEHIHRDWALVHEYSLTHKMLAVSHVWRSPDSSEYVIAAKGAPESIADLCHLTKTELAELSRHVDKMAGEGLRVLAIAKASYKGKEWPGEQHAFDYRFLGLVGLSDPIREDVPAALKESYNAGIRVIMITGDYPATAQSIARQIGLKQVEKVITGPEMDRMDDLTLRRLIREVNIFARVVPLQKLRIVNALRANGEVVAMTGDGVNDAPALKAADIGIAMGSRGTDVARESASIVLLDDDFSSIVETIRLGRRVYDNIQKAIAYIFAIHTPIIGMSVIPVVLNLPLVLFPVHIVFLELVIDPASSLVFEAEPDEVNVMQRPPRDPKTSLFSRRFLGLSLLQGMVVLAIVLTLLLAFLYSGHGASESRAVAYSTLIIANLSLIITNRSWTRSLPAILRTPNRAFLIVVGSAFAFLLALLNIPFLRDLFLFAPLSPMDFSISLLAGIASIVWFEGIKALGWFKH